MREIDSGGLSRVWRLSTIVLSAWLVLGCQKPVAPSSPVEEAQRITTYPARGTVRKVNPSTHSVVIAHEEIPGYMAAMAMEFDARAPHELEGLQPGDVVTFRLSVDAERSWIDQLHKVGVGAVVGSALPEPEPPLAAGVVAPDCALVDVSGRRFHVADYRGQVLVISFIFTRCPLPDFCPRLSTRFSELPAALSGAGERWHMLSISFDPAYDTSERLAAYATRFRADPARWIFATGEESDVLAFGAAFGLAVERTDAGFQHNLRTVVLDPAGRVARIFSGNTWTTSELAAEVQRAMSARSD